MIRVLVIFLLLSCLTACVGRSSKPLPPEPPPNVKALTAPTVIEGTHRTSLSLAQDPTSNGESLLQFALQCEAAVLRCNIDKTLTREYVAPAPVAKCKWYQFGCKNKGATP